MGTIGKTVDTLVMRIVKLYTMTDTPNLLVRLCVKYPNHKRTWWVLNLIKDTCIYLLWLHLFLSFANLCNPLTLCEPYIEFINNMTSTQIVTVDNFTFKVLK